MSNAVQILVRDDTLANWQASNPVLGKAEPAWVSDTRDWIAGDGVSDFNTLWTAAQSIPNRAKASADAAAASASAASSSFKLLRKRDVPAHAAVLNPAVTTDTAATSTIGPGGPSGITSARSIAYNDSNVTKLGCLPVEVTALGATYLQNQVSGATGAGATPWAIEFDFYGATFAIAFRNAVNNGSVFWVWVDGRPLTKAPVVSSAAGANSLFWYKVAFASGAAQRRVRIYMASADFGGLSVGPTDTVSPTPKPAKSLAILGDSWANGTGALNQLGAMAITVGLMLGVELFMCSYGGTGYVAPGQFVPFGNAARMAPLGQVAPDYVLVEGSSNDNGSAAADVKAAAAACYAAIKAASPKSVLMVCSVQATGTASSAAAANGAAVASAAQDAGALVVAQPIVEQWFTGTGARNGTPVKITNFAAAGSPYGTGGLPAGTYFAVITAITAGGESVASNEITFTVADGQRQNISWTAPTSAAAITGYNVYVGTASGAENMKAIANVSASSTAAALSGTGSAGTPPAVGPDQGAKGDGNADIFNSGTAPGHPTPEGHTYFARRLVTDIVAALPA
jgi:hypothetical protein